MIYHTFSCYLIMYYILLSNVVNIFTHDLHCMDEFIFVFADNTANGSGSRNAPCSSIMAPSSSAETSSQGLLLCLL